jgi:hypothetical protein
MADPRGVGGGLVPLSQVPQTPPAPRGAAGGARLLAAELDEGQQLEAVELDEAQLPAAAAGGIELTEAGTKANTPVTQQENPDSAARLPASSLTGPSMAPSIASHRTRTTSFFFTAR